MTRERNLIPGEQQLDEAEEIQIRIFTLGEVLDMIYSGKMQDSKTVSAILAYSTKLAGEQ